MSFFVAEDEAIGGMEDWGDCFIFTCKDDREAAMRDCKFRKSLEEGMGPIDDEEEWTFDEADNTSYSFPLPLSDYEAANMSVQPHITVNKARTDLFVQFKKEFDAIRGMIATLPEAGRVKGEIGQEKVATLLLRPDSTVYRVSFDVLGLDFATFSHFTATLYLTCRMSCNLIKLVEDNDINTSKYMDVGDFKNILHRMPEHGIEDEFTPQT